MVPRLATRTIFQPDVSPEGRRMAVLFLVVFVDLVGFGLLIPLLPFYVQRVGEGPEVITAVLGLYSLAQFLAAPLWGGLSDRFGRKPVLVMTSVGFALSYLLLAVADNLPLLIASRVFGGLMAGNIAAAQAYIGDVTTPENRARGMGLIGAAFGLGFVFGPAIGGVLGGPDLAHANFTAPALVAAVLTAIAAVAAAVFLKESLPAERRRRERHRLLQLGLLAGRRRLAFFVVAGFLMVTGFAQFETVFALWANLEFHFGPRQIGYVLTFMGVIGALVQGGLVGTLVRKLGERPVALVAVALLIVGYWMLPYVATRTPLLIAAAVLAFGSALFSPSLSSLVSREAQADAQGAVLGVYQSASALGRVVGPAMSGTIYAQLGVDAPYQLAGLLLIPVLALLLGAGRKPAH
jgi:DHA1 family tetracycline resistance protein-like MFS transporter